MLAGAPNFRDLGGHPAGPRRYVRHSLLFRSSQLSFLTPGDADRVAALGIVKAIDLRSARERVAQPTPAHIRAPDEYVSPKPDTDFVFNTIFAHAEPTAAAWTEGFATFYRAMLDDYAPEFIALFRAIADDRLPLLFHCSAGKDRTGAAAALILDLLGVGREVILADYLLSSARLDSDAHFKNMLSNAKLDLYADLPAECRGAMLGTSPVYLEALFEGVDDTYGSVRGYLIQHGFSAEDIDLIVDRLTEMV